MKEKVVKKGGSGGARMSGKRGKEPPRPEAAPTSVEPAPPWPAEGILRQALMSYNYADEAAAKSSSDRATEPNPEDILVDDNMIAPSTEILSSNADVSPPGASLLLPDLNMPATSVIAKSPDPMAAKPLGPGFVTVVYTTLEPAPAAAVEPFAYRPNDLFVTANSQLHALLNTPITVVDHGQVAAGNPNTLLNSLLNQAGPTDMLALPTISCSQVSSVLSAIDASYADTDQSGLEPCHTVKSKDDVIIVQVMDLLSPEASKQEAAIAPVSFHRCPFCPHLSVHPSALQRHVLAQHSTPALAPAPPALQCPGCSNVFYAPTSLSVHLSQDHQVSGSSLKLMVTSVMNAAKQAVNNIVQPSRNVVSQPDVKPDHVEPRDVKPDCGEPNDVDDDSDKSGSDDKKLDETKTDGEAEVPRECVKIRVRDLDKEVAGGSDDALEEMEAEPLKEEKTDLVLVLCGPSDQAKKRGRPKGSKNANLQYNVSSSAHGDKPEKDGAYRRCDMSGCAVRLQSQDNMAYHRRCHTEFSELMCPECGAASNAWTQLSTHLWRAHVIDMELYACVQCNYKTASYSKLVNLHQRIHFEDRPFLCDTCGKGFKNTKQLRNHKVVHLDRSSLAGAAGRRCTTCARVFTSLRLLRLHEDNVHRKLRPHLCNFCGYSASSRSSLKMHMRQHTGEKPFSCEDCDYCTSDHNSLRRHRMRHSGDKPYKCPHCSYACIQSSTFKAHLKAKHPGLDTGLMFSCDKCPFRSVKKDNYLSHLTAHSDKPATHITDMSLVANLDLLYVNTEAEQKTNKTKAATEAEEITSDVRESKFKVKE